MSVSKKITLKLDSKSIKEAIKQVNDYKKSFNRKVENLVETLVDEGIEIAKMQIREMGVSYTGELEESITGYFSPSLGVGIIKTDCPYAIFVEFGTGIVGKGSPHPAPEGWRYDVNAHGERGWVYFNERDQKWHWTKGMKSRPFMYNTVKELERMAGDKAKVVFRK